MKILLVEPYLAGSHASWASEYARFSDHSVEILSLEGRFWKWRMHGGAVTLARRFRETGERPDLILATDMLDLSTFLALTRRESAGIPVALYFHENQLTYPWSPRDEDPALRRDAHYGFINFSSALAADAVFFNSKFHRRAFLEALPTFLAAFPDHREEQSAEGIAPRSAVLPLGLDLERFDRFRPQGEKEGRGPLILWNHRWEYDKNPEEFFNALFALADEGIPFEVAVLGESYSRTPPIFAEARKRLGERVRHFGFAPDFSDYARWLWRADILPVTSVHDFFGASVVQAIHCGCHPLLPRRLAYPEHLPGPAGERFFYDDNDDLLHRLRSLCTDTPPAGEEAAPMVARYDWGDLAPQYDAAFEAVAGTFP